MIDMSAVVTLLLIGACLILLCKVVTTSISNKMRELQHIDRRIDDALNNLREVSFNLMGFENRLAAIVARAERANNVSAPIITESDPTPTNSLDAPDESSVGSDRDYFRPVERNEDDGFTQLIVDSFGDLSFTRRDSNIINIDSFTQGLGGAVSSIASIAHSAQVAMAIPEELMTPKANGRSETGDRNLEPSL